MSGAWDGRPRLLAVRPQWRSPLSQLKSYLQLAHYIATPSAIAASIPKFRSVKEPQRCGPG
jgi:hypothetical protein